MRNVSECAAEYLDEYIRYGYSVQCGVSSGISFATVQFCLELVHIKVKVTLRGGRAVYLVPYQNSLNASLI